MSHHLQTDVSALIRLTLGYKCERVWCKSSFMQPPPATARERLDVFDHDVHLFCMDFTLIQLNQLMHSYECGLEQTAQLFLLLHFMQSELMLNSVSSVLCRFKWKQSLNYR